MSLHRGLMILRPASARTIARRRAIRGLLVLLLLVCNGAIASTWWVRPYAQPDGTDLNYGAADGTSYHEAFDGLEELEAHWSSISPGDTVFICGVHIRNASDGKQNVVFSRGGTSGSSLIVRGDCSSQDENYENGVLTWLFNDDREDGFNNASWDDCADGCPDGAGGTLTQRGVYYGTADGGSSFIHWKYGMFEYVNSASDFKVLSNKQISSPLDLTEPGQYYTANADNINHLWIFPRNADHLYEGKLRFTSGYSYRLFDTNADYLTFYRLTFLGGSREVDHSYQILADDPSCTWRTTGLTYEANTFLAYDLDTSAWYCEYDDLRIVGNKFDGLDVTDNFFYPLRKNTKISNAVIADNYIHNGFCDVHPDGKNCDGHAIAMQGGQSNVTIERNYIRDFGMGIGVWNGLNYGHTNLVIRHNILENIDWNREDNPTTRGSAIVLQCNNLHEKGLNKNIEVYGNVAFHPLNCDATVSNCVGVRYTIKDKIKIYNNVMDGFNTNYYFYQAQTGGVNYDLRNNASLNPSFYHVYTQAGEDTSTLDITIDHNAYYPISGSDFWWNDPDVAAGSSTYAEFNGYEAGDGRSSNSRSLTTDPGLEPNYTLMAGAAAVSAGADVGAYALLHPNSTFPNGLITVAPKSFGGYSIGAFLALGPIEPPNSLRLSGSVD